MFRLAVPCAGLPLPVSPPRTCPSRAWARSPLLLPVPVQHLPHTACCVPVAKGWGVARGVGGGCLAFCLTPLWRGVYLDDGDDPPFFSPAWRSSPLCLLSDSPPWKPCRRVASWVQKDGRARGGFYLAAAERGRVEPQCFWETLSLCILPLSLPVHPLISVYVSDVSTTNWSSSEFLNIIQSTVTC